jgi:hypothetical protein
MPAVRVAARRIGSLGVLEWRRTGAAVRSVRGRMAHI